MAKSNKEDNNVEAVKVLEDHDYFLNDKLITWFKTLDDHLQSLPLSLNLLYSIGCSVLGDSDAHTFGSLIVLYLSAKSSSTGSILKSDWYQDLCKKARSSSLSAWQSAVSKALVILKCIFKVRPKCGTLCVRLALISYVINAIIKESMNVDRQRLDNAISRCDHGGDDIEMRITDATESLKIMLNKAQSEPETEPDKTPKSHAIVSPSSRSVKSNTTPTARVMSRPGPSGLRRAESSASPARSPAKPLRPKAGGKDQARAAVSDVKTTRSKPIADHKSSLEAVFDLSLDWMNDFVKEMLPPITSFTAHELVVTRMLPGHSVLDFRRPNIRRGVVNDLDADPSSDMCKFMTVYRACPEKITVLSAFRDFSKLINKDINDSAQRDEAVIRFKRTTANARYMGLTDSFKIKANQLITKRNCFVDINVAQ